MRFIIVILLGFSLPAIALELNRDISDSKIIKNLSKQADKPCDARKAAQMPRFFN